MASKNSHNAAFVTGAVLGGLAGAAAALWKTPYSGEELRAKITGGDSGDHDATQTVASGRLPQPTLKDKVLSTAEDLLAPVVGVKLGKTANDSGPTTVMSTTTLETDTTMLRDTGAVTPASATGFNAEGTGEPPAGLDSRAQSTSLPETEPQTDSVADYGAYRTGNQANVTPVDDAAAAPDAVPTGAPAPESEAATVEDLTTPHAHQVPDALKHEQHEKQPFPKLGGNEPGA